MTKRPTNPPKQQTHSWAIYHIQGTPAQFVGIVFDQPDQESAIKKAIEEYDIPANQQWSAIEASATDIVVALVAMRMCAYGKCLIYAHLRRA
jgi:hypothetical protein